MTGNEETHDRRQRFWTSTPGLAASAIIAVVAAIVGAVVSLWAAQLDWFNTDPGTYSVQISRIERTLGSDGLKITYVRANLRLHREADQSALIFAEGKAGTEVLIYDATNRRLRFAWSFGPLLVERRGRSRATRPRAELWSFRTRLTLPPTSADPGVIVLTLHSPSYDAALPFEVVWNEQAGHYSSLVLAPRSTPRKIAFAGHDYYFVGFHVAALHVLGHPKPLIVGIPDKVFFMRYHGIPMVVSSVASRTRRARIFYPVGIRANCQVLKWFERYKGHGTGNNKSLTVTIVTGWVKGAYVFSNRRSIHGDSSGLSNSIAPRSQQAIICAVS